MPCTLPSGKTEVDKIEAITLLQKSIQFRDLQNHCKNASKN